MPQISIWEKESFFEKQDFIISEILVTVFCWVGARHKAFEDERTTEMSTTDKVQHELDQIIRQHLLPATSSPLQINGRG